MGDTDTKISLRNITPAVAIRANNHFLESSETSDEPQSFTKGERERVQKYLTGLLEEILVKRSPKDSLLAAYEIAMGTLASDKKLLQTMVLGKLCALEEREVPALHQAVLAKEKHSALEKHIVKVIETHANQKKIVEFVGSLSGKSLITAMNAWRDNLLSREQGDFKYYLIESTRARIARRTKNLQKTITHNLEATDISLAVRSIVARMIEKSLDGVESYCEALKKGSHIDVRDPSLMKEVWECCIVNSRHAWAVHFPERDTFGKTPLLPRQGCLRRVFVHPDKKGSLLNSPIY